MNWPDPRNYIHMKNFILAASAFLSLSAHARSMSQPELVKSEDGKSAYCQSPSDLNRVAYRPTRPVFGSEGDALKLRLTVANLKCELQQNEVSWAANDLRGQDLTGFQFVMADGQKNILGAVPASSESLQEMNFSFPIQSSFSREELARLENGETLPVSWEFSLQGTRNVLTEDGLSLENYPVSGSYLLKFSIRKSGPAYVVSNLLLR